MSTQDEMIFIEKIFEEVGLSLGESQASAFLRYYELLIERNRVMNLTAITDFEEAVIKHFADSCMLFSPALSDARTQAGIRDDAFLIDVGTGAGFPGLPLKILESRLSAVLLDALQKRVDFLQDVITTLDLKGVEAVHARAEEGVRLPAESVSPVLMTRAQSDRNDPAADRDPAETLTGTIRETFDLAVSRAVAHLSVLSEYCLPYVRLGGCFAAYKSGAVDQELLEAENALKLLGGEILSVSRFSLTHYGDERSIVFIKKVKETPEKYPRKAGKPGKSPL